MIYLTLLHGAPKTPTLLIIRREISSYSSNNIFTLEKEFKQIPNVYDSIPIINAPDRTMEISLINFYFYTIRVRSARHAFLNLIISTRLSYGMKCNLRTNFICMKFLLRMLFFYARKLE